MVIITTRGNMPVRKKEAESSWNPGGFHPDSRRIPTFPGGVQQDTDIGTGIRLLVQADQIFFQADIFFVQADFSFLSRRTGGGILLAVQADYSSWHLTVQADSSWLSRWIPPGFLLAVLVDRLPTS